MMRLRLLCGVFLAALLVVGSPVRAGDDEDLSAAEQLARAIKLYDAGDYTAAQQALRDIKPEKLTDEAQQVQLQRYVAMVRLAISREAEAKDDFESASAAVQAKDLELAMHLFDRVVKNEFAPADLRSKAKSQFEEISAKLNAPPPTAQAAPPPAKAATSGDL